MAAPDLARRAPAAVERPSRGDEPRRTSSARPRGRREDRRLASRATERHPGDDRDVADPRLDAGPARGDGQARLPLRVHLVALARREDPPAHAGVRRKPPRCVMRAQHLVRGTLLALAAMLALASAAS